MCYLQVSETTDHSLSRSCAVPCNTYSLRMRINRPGLNEDTVLFSIVWETVWCQVRCSCGICFHMMLMFHDSKAPVGHDYIIGVLGAEIPHQLMVVVYPSAKNWFNLFLFHRRCRRSTFFLPSPIAFALIIGFCLQLNHKFCLLLNRSGWKCGWLDSTKLGSCAIHQIRGVEYRCVVSKSHKTGCGFTMFVCGNPREINGF